MPEFIVVASEWFVLEAENQEEAIDKAIEEWEGQYGRRVNLDHVGFGVQE